MTTSSTSGILLSQIIKSRSILANRFAPNSHGAYDCHPHEINAMIAHDQLDMIFTPDPNNEFKLGDYVYITTQPTGTIAYKIVDINPTTDECTLALDAPIPTDTTYDPRMQIYGTIVGTYAKTLLTHVPKEIEFLHSKRPELPSLNKIYVKYMLTTALNKDKLDEFIDELFEISETLKKSDVLYIISKSPPNQTIINKLTDIWDRYKIFIVVECIKNLQFDILSHCLVPKHIIMNDAETEFIMKKFNITHISQFPEISRFDPVARAICMRPGQVCRIIRPSKTSITSDYFRLCV